MRSNFSAKKNKFRQWNVDAVALALALTCGHASFAAEEERSVFIDPEDGYVDASEWLLDKKGFLPVPIVITEPAVGYGGGFAFLFFRESLREVAEASKEKAHVTPPDIFGGALAATENGTKAAGVGGLFSFADDRWRYRGVLGNADVNLDFYGSSNTSAPKVGYNLHGWMSSQQVLRRFGESDNFVALRWIYLDLDNTLETGLLQPPLFDTPRTVRSSGLGVSFEHDSRNNFFTASRGVLGRITSMFYSPEIGSDKKYQIYGASLFGYLPYKTLVFGGRLDGRTASGDVPLYQLPYIDLRGIPAARYQGKDIAVAETELRWNLSPRWALVGFVGAGRAWGGRDDFGDADTEVSGGAGFRYLIARRLGLFAGIDVARGPEEGAIYLQFGSAWR
jgi:hypothetical protein